jgi:hypothetical protein
MVDAGNLCLAFSLMIVTDSVARQLKFGMMIEHKRMYKYCIKYGFLAVIRQRYWVKRRK